MPAPATAAASKPRLTWPDVGKGLSIIGVVLLHVTLEVPGARDTFFAEINAVLDPLRMPLFFLISGLFSGKVMGQSLWQLFSRRLWFFLVPYVVWVPIEISLKYLQYGVVFGTPRPPALMLVKDTVLGTNMYWFLLALVAFNLVLWALRTLPRWAIMAASLLPCLWLVTPWHWPLADQAVMYLPVFLAGALFSHEIRAFAERALHHPVSFVLAAAGYVAGMAVFALWQLWDDRAGAGDGRLPLLTSAPLEVGDWWTLTRALAQGLMLPAAIVAVVALARVPVISEALQFIGRHTLPIYLAHPMALTLAYHLPMALFGTTPITPDAPVLLHNSHLWAIVCLCIAFAGGVVFWGLQKLPVLGWSVRPPAIAAPVDRWLALHRVATGDAVMGAPEIRRV